MNNTSWTKFEEQNSDVYSFVVDLYPLSFLKEKNLLFLKTEIETCKTFVIFLTVSGVLLFDKKNQDISLRHIEGAFIVVVRKVHPMVGNPNVVLSCILNSPESNRRNEPGIEIETSVMPMIGT